MTMKPSIPARLRALPSVALIACAAAGLLAASAHAGSEASSPSPRDLGWGIRSGSPHQLAWTAGDGALSHDVYFGTNATDVVDSRAFQTNQTGTTFSTPVLAPDAVYYWRVASVGATGTNTGSIWSFRTDNRARYEVSAEVLDQYFSDPPNEFRIVKYQLNNNHLAEYPQYGFGGYHAFFYNNLYKNGPDGADAIGPLVDAAHAQGRTVWSGDDNGYPSGSVGDKLVENNPEYEVRGVAMVSTTGSGQVPVSISTPTDCEKMVSAVLYPVTGGVPDYSQGQVQSVLDTGVATTGLAGDWKLCAFVLQIRDSNTQAQSTTKQFGGSGHYADLLNSNAVASWISLMHEPIVAEMTDPASQFEGFYFNEPSLMQLNWDTTAPYACLSWNDGLFDRFQSMHGYDLEPVMAALYEHDDLFAKRVRMHYHQTVAVMLRTSFTCQIADWCGRRGLAASGHPLIEESLHIHVANFGDMLKVVSELQVPAVDLPMPEPNRMANENYHFPKLMSSMGAWHEYDPRVIGLLDPIIGGYGLSRLTPSEDVLCNTVNRAARSGVNRFSTYIPLTGYGSTNVFARVNEYAGRISAMLTGARIASSVALYYPIEMFQMDYKPITGTHWGTWSPARQVAWDHLQTTMLEADVDFNIVHPEWLRDATVEDGELKIGSGSYRYLVMPDVEIISSNVLARVQQFEAAGGTVLWVAGKPQSGAYPAEDAQVIAAVAGAATVSAAQVPGLIPHPYDGLFRLRVSSAQVLATRFRRQGRALHFLVNPTGSSVTTQLGFGGADGIIKVYDPVSGDISVAMAPYDVAIDGYRSLLVSAPQSPDAIAAPTGVSATPLSGNGGAVSLDWDANTEEDLAGYTVYRGTTSGGAYQQIASGLVDSEFADTEASRFKTYHYVVVARDTDGKSSPFSTEVSVIRSQPNLIVIMIDDMGWADSSTYGSDYYQTPNLSRLADEGMLFSDAYAASPLCSPTRASIMSGQYPARLRMTVAITGGDVAEPQALQPAGGAYCGLVQNRNHLPLEVNTLAEVLKTGGYNTAHIGKWHLAPYSGGSAFYAEHQGFDYVIGGGHLPGPPDYYSPYGNNIRNLSPGPTGEYLNERLAQESIDWINSVKDSESPFFLNFWHYAVHSPIIAKEDLMPKYEALRDPDADQRCPEMATMLESMDTSIGMLLDWLDLPTNSALKANTMILLTSDNGGVIHNQTDNGDTWTSNRPLRGGKANTYEGGTRVPWIVRWPGMIEAGTTNSTPVQTTDIYPTVLEVAGIDLPTGADVDGQSIIPILEGTSTEHQPIFTDFPHLFGILCAPSCSVRVGDYKLIRYYHAGANAALHGYELFDLSRDPAEAINLAAYLPEKVAELDLLIEQHLTDTDALIPIASTNYTGSAMDVPRSSAASAPNRPVSVRLPETAVKTNTSGSRTIQLLDEKGQPRTTHALLLEGDDWVTVSNQADGSVWVEWDTPPDQEPAQLLFGWKGGATVREINDWTFAPVELLIGSEVSLAPTLSVLSGSFENPLDFDGTWGKCPAVWNDAGSGLYEVSGNHFTTTADGSLAAYMGGVGTIYQDVGSVNEGDTLSVVFYGGRAKADKNTATGGVFNCTFKVGSSTNTVSADTTLLANDSWQAYTNSWVATESGTLTLEFSNVSGKPWLDKISDVSMVPPPPVPPNVVVVYIDDMGWKDLSCYGSTFYETPVIDQLATEGVRFTDAYAACQICSPSRRALLTGKYPSRSNFTDLPARPAATGEKLIDPVQGDIMPNSEVLFPEIFQAAGYHTGFIGKWHLEVANRNQMATEHGFDVWDEIATEGAQNMKLVNDAGDPKEVSEITDKSIAFVQDAVTNQQPFMLYMSHRTVHVQLQTTPELHAKYDAKAPGENGQDNPYMAGMVEDLDTELGRFLQALETLGVADDTIIVFTSDNGGLNQVSGVQVTTQAPLRGGKGTEYEGGTRVPMIFKGPGFLQGALESTPTIQTDLYPTLVELAGLSEDSSHIHDGVSLVSLVRNGTSSPDLSARETIFWHYPHYKAAMDPTSYARKGDWVLILYNEQEFSPYGGNPHELYNLSTDLSQTTNLITQYPLKAAELYDDIVAHRQETAAQMPTVDPAYVWAGPSTSISLPGRFEAEDYDYGGEGAGYHDVDADTGTDVYRTDAVDMEASLDTGAGFNIASASAGEWLDYHVNIGSSAEYDLFLRVATGENDREVILTLDGAPLATVDVPNTGGDQTWTTVDVKGVTLPAGNHVLRAEWGAQGGPNLNWIDVQLKGTVLSVREGSFEDPTNIVSTWGMCPAVWNDAGIGQYEVCTEHLTVAADGNWSAYMGGVGTIYQELGTVNAGDTLSVVFYGGRAKADKNTATGGVFNCTFKVGASSNTVSADTTLLANDSWQAYTNSWVATESGTLTLEFSNVSGKPWLDKISDVSVIPPTLPGLLEGTFQIDGTGQAVFTIETSAGIEYRLVYINDLTSTNGWLPVVPPAPDGWTNGVGGSILISDPGSAVSTPRFYRIEARIPPSD